MKKLFLLISTVLLLSLTINLYAQTGDFGLSVAVNSIQGQIAVPIMTGEGALLVDANGNIVVVGGNRSDNSYSFSIVPKYYIKKDILLRFEFVSTYLGLKANADDKFASNYGSTNAEVTNKIFRYAAGFQWFFMKEKKIESYFGMTATYINYQSLYYNISGENRDLVTDTILAWGSENEIIPGGFGVGVGALVGINIYLYKSISLGTELSSSALYYKVGGETISQTIQQALPNPSFTFTDTYSNSFRGFKISGIMTSFNITFRL